MREIAMGMAAPEGVALTVLTHLGVGKDSCKMLADYL
jgi:hypothetical protein